MPHPTQRTPPPRRTVVCDFDGTLSRNDIGGLILSDYADSAVRKEALERFYHSAISLAALQATVWPSVRISPTELDRVITEQPMRAGVDALITALRDWQVPFHLVSGGFDLYITPLLERHGIDRLIDSATVNQARLVPLTREGTQKSRAAHTADACGVEVTFPYQHPDCGYCSNCKGLFVKRLRAAAAEPLEVTAIGDGWSDRCMARAADRVFARGDLLDWCKDHHIAATPFETLLDVRDALAKLWSIGTATS